MASRVKDLTGRTFSKLTVIEQDGWYIEPGSGRRKAQWRCLCACGAEVTVEGRQLTRGKATSCGCFRRGLAADRIKRDQLAGKQHVTISLSQQIWQAKYRAERNGKPFELTHEEFSAIRTSPCAMCGFDEGPVSIDRIDSEKGYTLDNVQPLCRMCQVIKSAFPAELLKRHIRRIVHHQGHHELSGG